jgi:hypothetical protein
MVANLKNIKREVKMSDADFFDDLKTLLEKKILPSDNQLAPHLKAYSIVRDMQSEYVFNGRFMFTVLNMAVQEYERDMGKYKVPTTKEPDILKESEGADKQSQQGTQASSEQGV